MRKTPNTSDNIEHFLAELENHLEELTDWEQGFVESVSDQFTNRGTLTDAQFEKLEQIYAEKTP